MKTVIEFTQFEKSMFENEKRCYYHSEIALPISLSERESSFSWTSSHFRACHRVIRMFWSNCWGRYARATNTTPWIPNLWIPGKGSDLGVIEKGKWHRENERLVKGTEYLWVDRIKYDAMSCDWKRIESTQCQRIIRGVTSWSRVGRLNWRYAASYMW